ncbi:MAG: hypothetical protein HY575_06000 [candidate division NC10 bacterium]|nr:hypothetical protein [candidate division NC10 bacterium]MBI4391421.1 hypothetical protein [candidate division NC10 bacterium]
MREKSNWAYLSHVPLGEFWAELKAALGAWVVISGLSLIILAAIEMSRSATESVVDGLGLHSLPRWVLLTAGAVALLWLMRGKHISWKIPYLTFTEGVVVVTLLGISFFASEHLSSWIAVPLFWALAIGILSMDRLGAKGRELTTQKGGPGDDAA